MLNISDRPLTEQQTHILAKGLNYNVKDENILDYIADLESTLKNTELTEQTKGHTYSPLNNNEPLQKPTYQPQQSRTKSHEGLQDDDIILPKIHKETIPILSFPGSPTYELSKFHAKILHPLIKTSHHTINNASAFLTEIKDLKLEHDEIMISFDVVSLFTSIPLDTAKHITNELLINDKLELD